MTSYCAANASQSTTVKSGTLSPRVSSVVTVSITDWISARAASGSSLRKTTQEKSGTEFTAEPPFQKIAVSRAAAPEAGARPEKTYARSA